MLAASFRRDVHLNIISGGMIVSRVPRCLFGPPNPKDTVDLLQEALDMERSKFTRRWGVDPCDDKENNSLFQRTKVLERSPRKRTTNNPYARQTNIHGTNLFSRYFSN